MRVVVRGITTPDLLAAQYQQAATRAATAAIAEVETVLPRCLDELARLAAQSANGGPDWVHVFSSLLPTLPLSGEGVRCRCRKVVSFLYLSGVEISRFGVESGDFACFSMQLPFSCVVADSSW